MRPHLVFLLLLSLVVTGCAERYGQDLDNSAPRINVMKALTDQSLRSKEVNIQGTILAQCSSGCWFFLKDDTGQILVDLAPNHFTIPMKSGKKVIVRGTLSEGKGSVKIIGKSVEIS